MPICDCTFQFLVVRKNAKLCAPKVTPKALDRPSKATSFKIERSPAYFRVKGSTANIGDGSHGTVGLSLVKCSTKAIDAGVALHPEGARAVLHGVPIREEQDRRSGEFCEQATHDGLHVRCEQ